MKSRVRTYSKKEIGWLCGEAMEEIDRCINSNGIVFLIALMRHTGWKKKRIEDFLLTLNTTMDEYHKHCLDNVFDYMAGKELAEIGIDPLGPRHVGIGARRTDRAAEFGAEEPV